MVSIDVGNHVPVTPFEEVVSKVGAEELKHSVGIVVNVGTIWLLTVTRKLSSSEHELVEVVNSAYT